MKSKLKNYFQAIERTHHMKNILLFVFVITIAVSGCSSAKKANEVSATYVPIHRFSSMNCQQLINEAESLRRSTPALEAAVDAHRSQQSTVEVVTWILFWPAAFALDKGERQTSDLAQARGELQAIQQALLSNNCNKNPTASPNVMTPSATSLESKLVVLKNLFDQKILTEDQYNKQVKSLLSGN